MKAFTSLLIALFLLTSCSSIRVISDYDSRADFSNYKTFAYFKSQIDKVEISDLDKRRILRATDVELERKGLVKSNNPDFLVSFETKTKERMVMNNNFWGWGWSPWFWGAPVGGSISTQTEGTLFLNIIDAQTKQLVWQGKGSGSINEFTKNRDERIHLFVREILEQYPPEFKNTIHTNKTL